MLRSIKALGRFGTLGKKIFTNIELCKHDDVMKKIQESRGQYYRGLDFGFAVSYNALVEMVADRSKKELYIYSEYYSRGKKNSEIMEDVKHLKNRNYVIIADSAEPKTIKEFNDAGFRVLEAKKGQGSVKSGIKKLQEFDKIYISDNCQNVWREFDTLEHPKDEHTGEANGSTNED